MRPTALVVEVTETGMVADLDTAVTTLTALRHPHRIRTAIHDFGTGWSSLTYVRRLPASILTLDQTIFAQDPPGATTSSSPPRSSISAGPPA